VRVGRDRLEFGSPIHLAVAKSECLFVIKSELNLVLVESESELCTRGNNTSHVYFSVRLTPERESVFGLPVYPYSFWKKRVW
jgi:hypothetical protein